jgi:hypothetical protein
MRIREELTDPWGWLVAGVSGGVGWAVIAGSAPAGVPVLVGVVIGAGVLATKVGVGALRPRRRRPTSLARDRLPAPTPGGAAAALLDRADRAAARMSELVGLPADPWLRGQVVRVDGEAARARDSLGEVAGRVTLLEQSLAESDPRRFDAEWSRLTMALALATDEQLRTETAGTLVAIEQQRQVVQRLGERHDTMLRRMETAVTGMEGLAARMGEIVAIGASSIEDDEASSRVGSITDELEALRLGLDEARLLR